MNPSYFLGVDVAKRNVRFHLLDTQGQRRGRGSIPTTAAGLSSLLEQLTPLGGPATILIVMETTGLLHIPWAEALTARRYPVLTVNALVAHRVQPLANALRGNKTDQLDAAGLAELGRRHGAELARFRYQSEPPRFGLQRLLTVRQQLRDQLTNLRKAYGNLLDGLFPELSTLLNNKIHGRRIRALLAAAPTPAELRCRRLVELQRAFGARTDAVLAAARDSLGSAPLAAAAAPALQALLSAIASLETQLAALELSLQAQTLHVVSVAQLHLVRSVRGIGAKTSIKVAAYLPTRFWQREYWQSQPSRRRAVAHLLAFMGAEPRVLESGQWKGQDRMSKRGCEPLRTALFQASFCGQKCDPELAALYAHHKAQGKAHKVCISHLMRRQTQRLIGVLQSGQAWSPSSPAKESTHAFAD
jgi:transposase